MVKQIKQYSSVSLGNDKLVEEIIMEVDYLHLLKIIIHYLLINTKYH